MEQESYVVSHLVRTGLDGSQWAFPEDPDVHVVESDQIFVNRISVQYHHSIARIRCSISKTLVSQINKVFEQMKLN